jgi:ubiquinone/menaquinone biosynthesis C-methylase UbiE
VSRCGAGQVDVANLPFDPETFDAALCQMALMFFSDRQRAIGEMGRVVKADGTVVVMVPSSLDAQPAYRLLVELAARQAPRRRDRGTRRTKASG